MGSAFSVTKIDNSFANQTDKTDASNGVIGAIKSAAARTGVDFSYLLQKASQESGLSATAKSSNSSAQGLFQFTSQTWLSMVKNHGAQYGLADQASQITADANGHLSVADSATRKSILALRNDPQISAEMAGELDKQNAASLKQSVGGKIGGTELYLAHFLGAGGASEFLSNMRSDPNASAADVVPTAAAANQSVFFDKNGDPRSLKEIYQHFAAKFQNILSPTANTQLASAAPAPATSTVASSSTVAASQATMASLMPIQNAASTASAVAPNALSNGAGLQMASANISLSGSSAQFAAMVLGQMNAQDKGASSAMADSLNDKKKSVFAQLSAVG
jgi:hypothetical protein